jgi:Protein of unknown function (DUF2586)
VHYHLSEVFRLNPGIKLWVYLAVKPAGEHTFAEVDTIRAASLNKIRQLGIWTPKAYAAAQIALLQGKYDDAISQLGPLEIFYSPNFYGVTADLFPDMSTQLAPNVHLLIAQDGAARGRDVYLTLANRSVGVVGAAIGAVSLAAVHENIGWVEKFNMAVAGGELDVPALANGTILSTLSNNITKDGGTFDTKRLIFLKKHANYTGTYFNDSHGCIAADNDYAYAEDSRTIDKAIRGIYAKLLPRVNGPVPTVNGKLQPAYVSFLQTEAGRTLEDMERAGELSGYTVTIDADQDVNATSEIEIYISNQKVGVSRRFKIKVGY